MKSFLTLGIETSCDETGVAVYDNINGLRSHALYSQLELHQQARGVIPEIASRSHLEKIEPIMRHALHLADVTIDDIDVIAVTNKPGLPGSLLIGVSYAKALAWSLNKKLVGVNHLEGHAFSSFLEHTPPFPHLCLTASGGHTSLYLAHDFGNYEVIGMTKDDAAGEAFDKIAKLLDLPYPGGPVIEKRAALVSFQDFFHYPRGQKDTFDFSFSGLKTAILYDMVKRGWFDLETKQLLITNDDIKNQIASSLLVCIADIFTNKIERALTIYPDVKAVTFVGGVACNKYIAQKLRTVCTNNNLPLFIPSPQFCTDNGAMIAYVGSYKAARGEFSGLDLEILR